MQLFTSMKILMMKINHQGFCLDGIAVASISLNDARDLEKNFTEDEVWNSIAELGNEKTPGLTISI